MRVAIDIDGVLSNFTDVVTKVVNEIWPNRLAVNYEPSSWNWTEVLSKEEQKQVFGKVFKLEALWASLPAYKENVHALRNWLREKEHTRAEVYFVTSRIPTWSVGAGQDTVKWLAYNGLRGWFSVAGIIVVDNPEAKAELYKILKFDYSIDDKKETVEQCDQIENHQAFLLDRPWNQDAVVKNRVKTLGEFLNSIT